MNKGKDKALDRDTPVDFTAKEMDVPASNENKSSEDENIPDEQNWQYNKKGARPERKKDTDHPDSDEKI